MKNLKEWERHLKQRLFMVVPVLFHILVIVVSMQLVREGIRQVTTDHSYVNVLLESGEITEEEAANHPQRNWIMKALGSERTIEPDFHSLELEDEQYLLICTDGLSNKVDNKSMQDIVLSDTLIA